MKKTLFFTSLLFIFLLLIILLFSSLLVGERTSFFGKATTGQEDSEIATENSYLFASPLLAEAGDKERIRVTIFILNSKGLGVPNKKVVLGSDKGISVSEVQATTDNYGKALFDVTATNPGEYLLEASVGAAKLPQTVKVSFR